MFHFYLELLLLLTGHVCLNHLNFNSNFLIFHGQKTIDYAQHMCPVRASCVFQKRFIKAQFRPNCKFGSMWGQGTFKKKNGLKIFAIILTLSKKPIIFHKNPILKRLGKRSGVWVSCYNCDLPEMRGSSFLMSIYSSLILTL